MEHTDDRIMHRTIQRSVLHGPDRFSRHGSGFRLLAIAVIFAILMAGLLQANAPAVLAQGTEEPAIPAATTIIVDTSTDLDSGSITKTCNYTFGVYVAAGDGCTLRRALLEAAARPQSDRPITIRFNLANNDPNKNKEVNGTWTLTVDKALPPLKTDTIIDKNGQVTIDGNTQPGGRSAGPKIIIDTNDFSLEVESENNVIRNLAFKGGGVIFLKEDGNTVENIWMGLSDDGKSIVFRTPGQPNRMAGGGVHISSDNNTVRDSVISGAFARAVDIDGGDNNLVEKNRIGTRADGTVPTVAAPAKCLRSLNLDPQNWYGGWGIALSGSNNRILNNRIAGLHIIQSANDTPPMAIEIFGADHEVSDNIIGLDINGKKVGVCGQGIKVSGSGTDIMDNTIMRSRQGFEGKEEAAILASDSSPLFGQITVRGNLVEDGPGNIYEFGPGIPPLLRNFNSAKITSIVGKTVSGTAGDGSPCPGCRIDFYRDDGDGVAEAFEHLGSTTAKQNGNFTFTMAKTLPAGSGIRTMSTTQSAGVIGNYLGGTTTEESVLYLPKVPMSGVTVDGPKTGKTGVKYKFTITVTPSTATTPFDYTVNATDFAPLTANGSNSYSVVASYTWTKGGVKTLNVTVKNDLGTIQGTHKITIAAPKVDPGQKVYMPYMDR